MSATAESPVWEQEERTPAAVTSVSGKKSEDNRNCVNSEQVHRGHWGLVNGEWAQGVRAQRGTINSEQVQRVKTLGGCVSKERE